MKFTQKNLKYTIITVLFFTVVISSVIFIPVYTQPYYTIINEINNGVKLSGDRLNPIRGGWDSLVTTSGKKDIVLTTLSVTKPIYTIVNQYSGDSPIVSFQVVDLERVSLFDFKVITYTYGYTRDHSFEEVVKLSRENNLAESSSEISGIFIQKGPSAEDLKKLEDLENQQRKAYESVPEDIREKMKTLTQEEHQKWADFIIDLKRKGIKNPTDDMVREFFKSIGK